MVQMVKNLPAMQETQVLSLGLSLGWEDPLEKEKTTHSSILAPRRLNESPLFRTEGRNRP